jgi:DNA primase
LRGIDMILKGGLNVRVLLFPDGEDPDSYSRKVGSTAFQKFLVDNAQDFVSFKINLNAKDAINDPIKKVESLREISDTLSLLPDEVRRSPYYRQVKDLLGVDESTIINEINKIRIKRSRGEKKESKNESIHVEAQEPESIDVPLLPEYKVYTQEKETIRLLLKYADDNVGEEKVKDFFINELSDVEFSHPTYKKVLSIIKERLHIGEPIDLGDLLALNDQEVSNCITEVFTERHLLSPNWFKKFQIFVPEEKSVVDTLVNTNVLRVKFRIVQKMIDDNLSKIRIIEKDGNIDLLDESLEIHSGLKQAENELAKLLGIVIAK